jgi:acetyl esterase
MNFNTRLVLWFSALRPPLKTGKGVNISSLRKNSVQAAKLGSSLFDRKLPVALVEDIVAEQIPLRIYRPSIPAGDKIMVYFHGGGFVLYGLDSHDRVCRRLCNMNACTVVSVDYRLAPEHTYPAAHSDAWKALEWVRKNALELGGSANSLIVAGDSAGGNLAACMAHRSRKENLPLRGQVLIYPWIDGRLSNPSIRRNGKGFLLEESTIFWFQEQYTPKIEDRCAPGVSPCFETEFSGLAPALVLTASLDPLLDDGFNYHLQMQQAGTQSSYKMYPDLFHGFFNLPLVSPMAMRAYEDIEAFVNKL